MKKKNLWIALLALLLVGGVLSATLAFFTDEKQQQNNFVMGSIGITLSEPQFARDTEGTYLMDNVLPNQTIVKDPQISVNADSLDVYLRASISYAGLSEEACAQLEENIAFEKGWYKGEDGKFYYNQVASENDVVAIFNSVVIPWQWGNEMLSRDFKIIVSAEAIQADYFTPDTIQKDGQTMVSSWRNKDGTVVTVQ